MNHLLIQETTINNQSELGLFKVKEETLYALVKTKTLYRSSSLSTYEQSVVEQVYLGVVKWVYVSDAYGFVSNYNYKLRG
ncbi:MAG: hypothetical protein Q7I99_02025 [Acholeplasmataceae bacterium]|nr:hypothetical protein [Acholeplasmataceae bacterium]